MTQQTRRKFLRDTALAGAGMVILSNSRSAHAYAANEMISFALVGCGGRGASFLADKGQYGSLFDHGNVVVMCDVNQKRAAASFAKFPDAPKFEDYRVMLDKMGKRIDAVVVATCDHNHAAPSAAAIRAGKPTYCEKGLTRTIHEARALGELADQYKVVTQEGNNHGYNVRTVELIRAGTIGEVREVHLSAEGGSGPRPRPTGAQDVPAGLNWDLWLGPAADRPYHGQWMAWGQWREFSNGYMGMWGSHSYPAVFKGLKLGAKGLMYSSGHGCHTTQLLPADKFKDVGEPRPSLPRPLGKSDLKGWIEGIRGGPLPQCNFAEFGGPFTEWTHLANVATLFPDQTLEFDPVACKIINVDEANEAVAPEYRKGWSL